MFENSTHTTGFSFNLKHILVEYTCFIAF